ncbi:MAG TPA: S9 family peptidase, partial [Rhodanobacteraceae bacterium]|nr:S9 family peptidase [Rhodanobacteraceae bacterium]
MKRATHPTVLCATLGALCLAFNAGAAALPGSAAAGTYVQAHAAQTHKAKSTAHARAPRPMATYWGGLDLSPHGKHLAWVTFAHGAMHLQIADADATHARDVAMPADAKDCRPGAAIWSPDGSQLAFLSNCGNKDAAQRDVWLVDASAAKPTARRLTHLDGLVQGLAWSPDGHALGILYVEGDTHPVAATAASKPRVGVIGVHGIELQQVAQIDAATGKVRIVTPKSLFVYEFDFSPDGQHVAYIAAPPPGANNWWKARLYTQAVGSSQPQQLVDAWTASGSLHHLQMAEPRFSPDGKTIAFIGGLMSDQGATGGDIYLVPTQGGAAVNVTPGIHVSPTWFTWEGNNRLLVSSFAGAETEVGLFSLNGTQAATHKALFKTPSALRGLSVADDGSRFVFLHSTFNEAPEIYAGRLTLDRAGEPTGLARPVRAITSANAKLERHWGKGVEINWHNEGYDISGWLLLPRNYDPHKKYPMIVNVHGGPVWGYRASWPRGSLVTLSQEGYFVFMPNPRGSLGQGEAFTKAVRRDMGYGDLRDILSGIDAVEKQYSVDDNRLGLTGWSYGGFMAMFAPTQTHRFKAAVAGAGLSNWQSYYGENMIDQWMLPFFGASVYDDPAVYAKSSAINFIKNDTTPTLIVVGQFDKECPAPQSFEMWHALRTMDVPTTLVVYAGEGHGF